MGRSIAIVAFFLISSVTHAGVCPKGSRFVVAIHGGAGNWEGTSPAATRTYEAHGKDALAAAHQVLAAGGSSLDAVTTAVELMENRGLLNAGKGAVRNSEGAVELDASVMDGRSGLAGAVASVRTIKNPVRAARRVMEQTKHVLLVADGADRFAKSQGLDIVTPAYFEEVKPELRSAHGTVGAVALDCEGHLAAATSTGGLTMKLPGRVGDSPLIGAGTYANDATCAVSGTGTGEFFIRAAAGHDVSARMAYAGQSLADAAQATLTKLGPPDTGGMIAVDRSGNVTTPYNTKGMLRGWMREDGSVEVRLR